MFRCTFLGHQGWLFSADGTHVLVDPLLTDEFCDAGRVGKLFPPRRFGRSEFPRVSAVLFTHEHNDHFAIPTLNRLDRAIPVYLSCRASHAARTILRELGFTVHALAPGLPVAIGALTFHPFSPDYTRADNGDEWDVLPYLVHDRAGHGNFFSHVDVEPQTHVEAAMRAIVARPGIWCCTNNGGNWAFSQAGTGATAASTDDGAQLLALTLTHHARLCAEWSPPAALVWCGNGLSFEGERSWLNRNVFSIDSGRICAGMRAVLPQLPQRVPLPGDTLSMVDGVFAGVGAASFVTTTAQADWPDRSFVGDVARLATYAPACGRRDTASDDIAELTAALRDFARHLYGSPLFRRLYALDHAEIGARKPTFSLVLLADDAGGAYVYEYDAQGCRFVPAEGADPVRDYVGGIECWASDLLAVCRGQLAASAIVFGRARVWNFGSAGVGFHELCLYFHPLRRPDTALGLYRTLLAADGKPEIMVHGPRA